jgi:predicted nucleic acid-binding protein
MTELADTSAWFVSRRAPELRSVFDGLVETSAIATCDAVKLELLHTARNGVELTTRRGELDQLPQCPIGPAEFRRALDVYERFAHQGGLHHRRVKHADLLIAAAAESAAVTLLHYDQDFDAIAELTGQATRWIAPKGTL